MQAYALTGEISFEGVDDCHGGACSGVPRRRKAARSGTESMARVVREEGGGSSRAGSSLIVTPGCNFAGDCSGF